MFEKEIDRLYSLIIERTIGNADNIAIKEILAAEIPKPIQVMIRMEIETKLIEEIRSKFVNSRFNFSHPEVISLQNQINSILVLNYYFTRKEYLEILQDSIHLLLNYLVRPHWTLLSYIYEYEGISQSSSDQIINTLKRFCAHDYLKMLIIKVIKDKNIKQLNAEKFSLLLWKCDREFIRRKDGYQVANITSDIYDFVNFGLRNPKTPINIKSLIKFFEDKKFLMISKRLEAELQRDVNEISLDDLGLILEDLRKTSGGFEAEPIRKQEITQIKSEEKSEKESELKISLVSGQDQPSTTSFEPLENFITEDDKRRFIKKIFRKNEKDYLDAIFEINKMKSWKEASKYIDEIFILNDVDLYSPEAIKFTDLTYRRFYPDLER